MLIETYKFQFIILVLIYNMIAFSMNENYRKACIIL